MKGRKNCRGSLLTDADMVGDTGVRRCMDAYTIMNIGKGNGAPSYQMFKPMGGYSAYRENNPRGSTSGGNLEVQPCPLMPL